jgi:class 3 adenylate cyclase/tetratricopeptide (TPR) repeat protein
LDVGAWLADLGLGQYAKTFTENEIGEEVLRNLTAEDLKELGVAALGHRKQLLAAIADLVNRHYTAHQPATPQVTEGERRQVTVLFADISGFTRLSNNLGAEATHTLLNRYFGVVDKIVESYGGSIDKHMGDNVMAVFGAPVAHTDDPERAVRAAHDIHDAVTKLGDNVSGPLQVHIGIASGQVVASGTGSDTHREYTITGDSVNLASRLQNVARAGETCISDAVQRAVAGFAVCEAMDEVAIKGLPGPVRVWRLRGLRGGTAEHDRLPFVGRRSETGQFAGILAACRETGNGQAAHIRGEAGIGKTRLVEELRRLAEQQGFACHTGLVLDFGVGRGHDAIRAIVRSLMGVSLDSSKEARILAADRACADGLLSPDASVYLNDLLDLPQPAELSSIYDTMDNAARNRGKQLTVAALVQKSSMRRPLLIVVEDVHWADQIELAHLAALAGTVIDCPAVLVMTSRIEGDPINQAWRGTLGGSSLITIDLAPLRRAEALMLAAEYFDSTSRFALTCVERAGGNPLFLDQLLRNAQEIGEDEVPDSVQSLVQSRMDRLERGDRMALQAASVIGQRFTHEALRYLIESPQHSCAELVKYALIRPEGDAFLFAHALVRDGVYSSLLGARRKDLHRRAANWYVGQDSGLRAEHLDRAEDPTAGEAYLDAAKTEIGLFHYERARELAERGLEVADDMTTRYALICLHGNVLRETGQNQKSIEAFEKAVETAANDMERSAAWIGQAESMRILDRFDDALAALDKAESVATVYSRADHLTQIHYLRGNLYFPMGKIDGCLEQHKLALKFARDAGSVEGEVRALGGLGDAYYQRGHMITAHEHFRRCVEFSRKNGLGRIEVANLSMLGFTREYVNELREALKNGLDTIELALKVDHRRAELLGRMMVLQILTEMIDVDAAKEHLKEAWVLVGRLGARRFEPALLTYEAKLLRACGRRVEAMKLCERAMIICREIGVEFTGPRVLGELALDTDDPERRRQALHESECILRMGVVSHNHFYFFRNAMDACLDSGDWDEVDRYAKALEDFTLPEPLPWCDFFIARGRALSAHGRGEGDETTMEKLRRLRGEADRVGLRMALPAIDAVLAAAP